MEMQDGEEAEHPLSPVCPFEKNFFYHSFIENGACAVLETPRNYSKKKNGVTKENVCLPKTYTTGEVSSLTLN